MIFKVENCFCLEALCRYTSGMRHLFFVFAKGKSDFSCRSSAQGSLPLQGEKKRYEETRLHPHAIAGMSCRSEKTQVFHHCRIKKGNLSKSHIFTENFKSTVLPLKEDSKVFPYSKLF